MSWTGLDLRRRARRHLARALDALADVVDPRDPSEREPAPAPSPAPDPQADPAPQPAPPPAPEPASAPRPTPPPLPGLPRPQARNPAEGLATEVSAGRTPAGAKAVESAEERQARHWSRTREGVLRFVDERGGKAGLRDMHEYSERTFFVAHVQFSKLMEELTDEGLLDYDHDTATATLTEAGRAEI